jgi:hypothetical protein
VSVIRRLLILLVSLKGSVMAEKLFSCKCSVHGGRGCEVFVEKVRLRRGRRVCSKRRRVLGKRDVIIRLEGSISL